MAFLYFITIAVAFTSAYGATHGASSEKIRQLHDTALETCAQFRSTETDGDIQKTLGLILKPVIVKPAVIVKPYNSYGGSYGDSYGDSYGSSYGSSYKPSSYSSSESDESYYKPSYNKPSKPSYNKPSKPSYKPSSSYGYSRTDGDEVELSQTSSAPSAFQNCVQNVIQKHIKTSL